MNKIFAALIIIIAFASCTQNDNRGKFILKGEIKNIEDQNVYLEQLFFSDKNPEVLDTSKLKNGKFEISATAAEEGLYRLRLEKQEIGYIFINDKTSINFSADAKDISLEGPKFNTTANNIFKAFLISVNDKQKNMNRLSVEIDSLKKLKASDSIIAAKITQLNNDGNVFKNFIIKSIDTINDPIVAMFALGYSRGINPDELKTVIPNLAKRFPKNTAIAGIITQYNAMIAKKNNPIATPENNTKPSGKIGIGSQAPEIMMKDTADNNFSLSSLKGKYVLVDFWASWCAPCRGENPNVVANYNKFKNKNFTILGVSLDEDKAAWKKAIVKDKLAWKQVSDLKGWACAATATYGFDAIPYNVLIDPSGKIIATELREADLGIKLAEVLR